MSHEHAWERRMGQDDAARWTLRYQCSTCFCWGRVGRHDRPGRPVAYKRDVGPHNDFGGAAYATTIPMGLDPYEAIYGNDEEAA